MLFIWDSIHVKSSDGPGYVSSLSWLEAYLTASYPAGNGEFFQEVKRPESETDQSLPLSDEVVASILPKSFMACYLSCFVICPRSLQSDVGYDFKINSGQFLINYL
jgi:hypothetical protein